MCRCRLCSAQQQQANIFNPIPFNGWYNVKSIQQLLYVVYIVAFVTVLYIKTLTDLVFSLTDCAFLTEINIICTSLIKNSVTSSIIITARFSIKLFHLFFTTEYILLTPLLNHWMPAESKSKKKNKYQWIFDKSVLKIGLKHPDLEEISIYRYFDFKTLKRWLIYVFLSEIYTCSKIAQLLII